MPDKYEFGFKPSVGPPPVPPTLPVEPLSLAENGSGDVDLYTGLHVIGIECTAVVPAEDQPDSEARPRKD